MNLAPRRASGTTEKRKGANLSPRRRFILLGAALIVAIACADLLVIQMERVAAIENFRTAATNLTKGMAAQTARSIGLIDKAMRDLQSRLEAMVDPSPDALSASLRMRAVFEMLAEDRQRLTGIDSLSVVAPDGTVASSVGSWPQIGTGAQAPEFLRHFRQSADSSMFVSPPQHNPARNSWSCFLARRLNGPQGSFAGVLVAELSLSDLEGFYRTAMPLRRTVTLVRSDGIVLVRYPPEAGAIGRRVPTGAAWYQLVAHGGGSYVAPDYLDAIPVVAVVRPLPGLDLVLDASVTQAEALEGWQFQRLWLILGGIASAVGTVALLRLFAAQLRRLGIQNIALDEARGQLNVALSNIPQGLCFFDGDQRLILCNRRYGEMYGLPSEAMRYGTSLAEIVEHCYAIGGTTDFSKDEYMMSRAAVARAGLPHHSVIQMEDGRTIAIQQQPMPDGGWVATHEDITERRRAEEQINFMARHDVLTGLANRSLLRERISQARVNARLGAGFAVLLLDLDRFKAVNDTLGHAVGDELLREVAARLLAIVRAGDAVARLGGDEFVVLQASIRTAEEAASLAQRIIASIGAPYRIAGNEVVIGVSIGVETATSERLTADDLLKNADMALYIAKGEGRGTFRFFAPEMDATLRARHALERDLHCAVSRGEFELHYQPIVDAGSGRASGFEALLRWNHPTRGQVGPEDFIAVAEECGLIIPIGEWVILQACRHAATWPDAIHVSVNLSPVQFRAASLVDVVRDALRSSGMNPARLELEITESVLLQSNERNIAVLQQLRSFGVGIVMDDFGVGYSSLSYLRRFPFDRVKIDQSFVKDLTAHGDAIYFVRAIVGLCNNLGIRTTAEGVETAEQLEILVAEGCTEMQGHLFSRPKPHSHLAGLIGGAPLIAAPVLGIDLAR